MSNGMPRSKSESFVLLYDVRVRSSFGSFFVRDQHKTPVLSMNQARRAYNRLMRCKQVIGASIQIRRVAA